ncbi:ATP-binding protein [Falsiroseomonas sp.]|uniref:ATP-binding protein n=1 Tax=Falsiroseomonas sp. TaxID=2870721 RepID=UPI003F718F2E
MLRFGNLLVDAAARQLRIDGRAVAMPAPAFDILLVLARQAGQLVGKDAVMAAVWGAAAISDNTLQVHVAALRKALGAQRALLETTYGRGYRLLGDWTATAAAEAAPGPAAPPGNLPLATSRLIAREEPLDQVARLLAEHRLVTLIGAGGIGKTRLAIEVARQVAPGFRDGCWLVELASLSDEGLVPQAVARSLGQGFTGHEVTAGDVASLLESRDCLLLLDNCEHVIGAATELAETLLRRCPGLRILATSREVLRARDERAFRVPSLDVPRLAEEDAAAIRRHGAVALFLARMAMLGAAARDEEMPAIARICRQLDGIPLAIELAAARAGTLEVREVAARLDGRLHLLEADRRCMPPRHATLRATLEWSHDLLTPVEQLVFRRLAAFAGGFTLEAARAIAADADFDAEAVEEAVAGLVGKSLLNFTAAPASRWHFLETTRAFARERLQQDGEAGVLAARHADWFAAAIQAVWNAGAPQPEPLAAGARELENVHLAIATLFGTGGDPDRGARLVADFVPVWLHLGLTLDCQRRVERALAHHAAAGIATRIRLLATLTLILQRHAAPAEDSAGLLAELARLVDQAPDSEAQLFGIWAIWNQQANSDRHDAALASAARFAALARRTGQPLHQLVAQNMRGYVHRHLGRYHLAARHLDAARRLAACGPQGRPLTWMHYEQRGYTEAMLASVQWQRGELDQARRTASAALDIASASGTGGDVMFAAILGVAPIAIHAGDHQAARVAADLGDDFCHARGFVFGSAQIRCLRAVLQAACGDPAGGAALLEATLGTLRSIGRCCYLGYYQAHQATALLACGDHARAAMLLTEAAATADRQGERWMLPELLRLQAECLMAQRRPALAPAAEAGLEAALDLARRQGSAFWELRIAGSLGRLHRREPQRALPALRAALARIQGGADWPEVQAARALLRAAEQGPAGRSAPHQQPAATAGA